MPLERSFIAEKEIIAPAIRSKPVCAKKRTPLAMNVMAARV
jgi:hypothetical protein